MNKVFFIFLLFIFCSLPVYAESKIIKQDAYGYGVHMDQYGRPVQIEDSRGKKLGPNTKIKKNEHMVLAYIWINMEGL